MYRFDVKNEGIGEQTTVNISSVIAGIPQTAGLLVLKPGGWSPLKHALLEGAKTIGGKLLQDSSNVVIVELPSEVRRARLVKGQTADVKN